LESSGLVPDVEDVVDRVRAPHHVWLGLVERKPERKHGPPAHEANRGQRSFVVEEVEAPELVIVSPDSPRRSRRCTVSDR